MAKLLVRVANPYRLIILALAGGYALVSYAQHDGVFLRPASRKTVFHPRVDETSDADDRVLHMIMAVFNPANFSSRPRSARAQQARFQSTRGAILYTVELAYGDAPFVATDADNPRHLQVRYVDPATPAIVWAKENLFNLAVRHLLPQRVAALGFVDAEVIFENPDWAVDALAQILDGRSDVVIPFASAFFGGEKVASHGYERARLGAAYEPPRTFSEKFVEWKGGLCAYSWAYSWAAWQRMGAFYDKDLGTLNDFATVSAATCDSGFMDLFWPRERAPANFTVDFRDSMDAYVASACRNASAPRVGFVRGVVTHTEHGSKVNRGYLSLRASLVHYEPSRHVAYDAHGLLVPTPLMPRAIIDALTKYYAARKEDDAFVAMSVAEATIPDMKPALGD
jgi:hypothetical protein